MKYKSGISKLEAEWARAFRATTRDLKAHYKLEFDHDIYAWPRNTRRTSGRIAGTTRDILDTGALRDSMERVDVDQYTVQFVWPLKYALDVFLGVQYSTYQLPARDLPNIGFSSFNFVQRFMANLK
jgi:hypothetical protein